MMKYLIIFLTISVIIFALFGFFRKNNTRWFIKDNIKAWANLAKIGSKNYYVLEVGNSDKPFYRYNPKFSFKINDDLTIETKSMKIDFLESIADRRTTVSKDDEEWPIGTILLYVGPYSIMHNDGEILYFKAESFTNVKDSKNMVPIIGNVSCDQFYEFPLSEEEIIRLFGEPDKIIDFYRN